MALWMLRWDLMDAESMAPRQVPASSVFAATHATCNSYMHSMQHTDRTSLVLLTPLTPHRLVPNSWSGVYSGWGWDNREVPLRLTVPPPAPGAHAGWPFQFGFS